LAFPSDSQGGCVGFSQFGLDFLFIPYQFNLTQRDFPTQFLGFSPFRVSKTFKRKQGLSRGFPNLFNFLFNFPRGPVPQFPREGSLGKGFWARKGKGEERNPVLAGKAGDLGHGKSVSQRVPGFRGV